MHEIIESTFCFIRELQESAWNAIWSVVVEVEAGWPCESSSGFLIAAKSSSLSSSSLFGTTVPRKIIANRSDNACKKAIATSEILNFLTIFVLSFFQSRSSARQLRTHLFSPLLFWSATKYYSEKYRIFWTTDASMRQAWYSSFPEKSTLTCHSTWTSALILIAYW